MIAIISNKIDQYQNYNFKINFSKNYNKELKKCFNYNIKNHPNFLMNQFHLQSIKNNFKIDHYENIKNKDKIKLFIFLDVLNHEEIISESISLVRDKIGPVASFKMAVIIESLPKTRSGKILRGTMLKIANGEEFKVPATIDDPSILEEIKKALIDLDYPKNS